MAKSSTTTPRDRVENAVNTLSRPSDLKITDMRLAVVAANYDTRSEEWNTPKLGFWRPDERWKE